MAHGWKRVDAEPLAGAIILQQAEGSGCIWRVNQEAQKVTVSRLPKTFYDHPTEVRLQVANGTLVGEDRGEWGGGLSLLDAKGNLPRKILDKNVLALLQARPGVLVIAGSLPANEGSVWLYSTIDDRWTIEKKVELSNYPFAVGKSKDGILLVSGDGIYQVDDGFNIRQIAALPLLQTHPNSITEDANGGIYVGMQAFVVRLVPDHTGFTHEWFAGDGCLP